MWDIEDEIRKFEIHGIFDEGFVSLARKVYYLNDERAKIKNQINKAYGSDIMEIKSYEKYD